MLDRGKGGGLRAACEAGRGREPNGGGRGGGRGSALEGGGRGGLEKREREPPDPWLDAFDALDMRFE